MNKLTMAFIANHRGYEIVEQNETIASLEHELTLANKTIEKKEKEIESLKKEILALKK